MWIVGLEDFSYDDFTVVSSYKPASLVRRLFDWLLEPMVRVTIYFSNESLPCSQCYMGLEDDFVDLFGPDVLMTDDISYQTGLDPNLPVKLEISDPGRQFMTRGQDFREIVNTVRLALIECRDGHHHILEAV
jgi:hypothetical protein